MNETDLAGLPPEVRDAMRLQGRANDEKLAAFAIAIAQKRDEAVAGRTASGIESTWTECEEAYLGIDDANRHEYAGSKWMKPTTSDAPLTRRPNDSDSVKSTAFVRLTARYVDAGSAKVGEISIPVDGKIISMKATPVPDMVKGVEDMRQIVANGQPQTRPPKPEELPPPDATGQAQPPPENVPLTVKDLAEAAMAKAEKSAKAAETRIHDWLVQCGHPATMRKVIFDGARIGAGVLKGPVPERRKSNALTRQDNMVVLDIVEETVPVTRWVDTWNLFPDPACGENIHDGDYILERDFFSPGRLEALKRNPLYIEGAIEKVLREGPNKVNEASGNPAGTTSGGSKKQFEVWYFYGRIKAEDLELTNSKAFEAIKADPKTKGADSVFAIVTLVNDTPIRVVLNPLDSGSFPYHVFKWRRRAGHWAGVGVAEQVRLPQRLANSATRATINNAAKSAGSILVIDDSMVVPADGSWVLTPDKLFRKHPDAVLDDVRKAFAAFTVPNMTQQLMLVIEYAFKLAEESSNIPLITQGQSGKTTPDTFGGQQLQDSNANQMLRDVGFGLADDVTNPMGQQMYEWLLLADDVPNEEKGDHQIDTNAAIALVERAIQDQTLMALGSMVENPAFGIDPEKWFAAFVRTKRMSPDDFQFDEATRKKNRESPPPPPPQIAAAQIRAQSAEKIAQSHDELIAEKTRVDTDRDTAFIESQSRRDASHANLRIEELRLKRDLALLEFAKDERLSLAQAKTKLATEAMGIQAQFKLAGLDGKGPEVATPPTEPPGQAPDGTAYQA